MIPQTDIHPSAKKQFLLSGFKREVTPEATAPSDVASDTTGTAVHVTEFDFAHNRHEYLLLKGIQANNPEHALRNISNSHVRLLAQSFLENRFAHERRTLFVTTTAVERRSKKTKAAPPAIPLVLDDAASMVLLPERH